MVGTSLRPPTPESSSASTGTREAAMHSVTMETSASTSAASVALPTTTPSLGGARPPPEVEDPLEYFKRLAEPQKLIYSDFSDPIAPHTCLSDDPTDIKVFERICMPYDSTAFEEDLSAYNLTNDYPILVRNLHEGFPIGNMPSLEETIIIPNHPSCLEHEAAVDAYIAGEIAAGRMSGPFTEDRAKEILGGHFFVSPLIVATQTQEPGVPDKLRVCRHLSKEHDGHPSVNSHIEKEAFPTLFDTALRVADIVSSLSSLYSP
jgi:hypothetical protein